jgi:hypothetical protein
MANADAYAEWIVANKDKKGTPDFETVAAAYREAVADEQGQSEASGPSIGRMAADTGIEVGGAIAGQLAGAPLAPATFGLSVPIGGAIGGAAANIAVQRGQIARGEREDFSFGELAVATGLSAIPGGKALKGGATLGKTIAKRAVQGAGISTGSELAKTLIDEGRAPTAEEFTTALAFGTVTGGALGGAETAVSKYASKAVSGIKEYGAIKALVPTLRKIDGEKSQLAVDGEFAIRDMDKALRSIKDNAQRAEAADLTLQYLRGKTNLANVPEAIAPSVKLVRKVIDDATERGIQLGLVEGNGALENAMLDNLGAYLNRSYKVFNGWRPDIPTMQRWVDGNVADRVEKLTQRAIRSRMYRAQTLQNMGIKAPSLKPLNELRDDVLKRKGKFIQEYTDIANQLVDRDGAMQFATTGRLNARSGVYRRKKDIDPLTRELLGEIHAPVYLASETLGKMTASEAKFKVMQEVAGVGKSTGLFRTNSQLGDVLVVQSEDKLLNPLAGLYTTPEIRNAFNAYTTTDLDPILKNFGFIASLSSAAKLPKTLGSLKGWASNVWGGAMDTIAQGHGLEFLRAKNYATAKNNFLLNLGIGKPDGTLRTKETLELFKFFRREGLVRGNVQFNDFKRGLLESDKSFLNRLPTKAKEKLKGSIETVGKLYSAPETAGKVFNFYGELAALRRAYPAESMQSLMKKAAQKVRLTTQDYDSLPKFIRNFSSVGFLDPFVSYTADRFRVVFNTYKLGFQEMASGNAVMRNRGASRIAAMSTILGGVGYVGSNPWMSREEEEAVRNRMPSWDKDGLVTINKNDDGTYSYINLNYTFPHSTAIEAASLAARQATPEEAFSALSKSLGKQLFGANLLLAPVSEVVSGKTKYGTPITSENAPIYKQFIDNSSYFLDNTLNPLVVRETNKFFKTLKSKDFKVETPGGQVYTMNDLLAENFGGIRKKTFNPYSRLKTDAFALSKAMSDDRISYASARKRALDDAEKQTAYQEYLPLHGAAFDKVKQIVNDSKTLGLTDEEIALTLKEGRIDSQTILGALTDTYMPPPVEKDRSAELLADEVMNLPAPQRGSAISKIAREQPQIAASVANRVKSQMRDLALGVNEVDRLIGALDANDGTRAKYITQQLSKLGTQQERQAYINELQNKRLLTPLVYEQVKAYLVSQ